MWCREGVQAESSGMPLARSLSGWDRLHRHDFKREKIAVMSPAEAAASLQGNISSSSSPFSGMGEKHVELSGQISSYFHAALTAFVHVKSKGNTLKIFFRHRLRLQQQICLSWVPRAKTGTRLSRQQVVFIPSPLKWAEQTGSGAFKHSLLAGTHETTLKKKTGSND